VLYLIHAIAPSLISNDAWSENLDCVLNKLIAKGNLAAPLRRLELRQLETILAPLTPRNTTLQIPPLTPLNNAGSIEDIEDVYAFDEVNMGEEFGWDVLALNPSVSLPPRELLDLADQLDMDGIM
jgi:hypothetical protein